MKIIGANLGAKTVEIRLPANTDLISMKKPTRLSKPLSSIKAALKNSSYGPSLDYVIEKKLRQKPDANVVIVISDNTRPVPYSGRQGILWPIIEELFAHGITAERFLILVANGTHRPLTEEELRLMLDPRLFTAGITIKNHDCDDKENLVYLGRTSRGSEVYINREYMEADLKILTGLVESHFMAGASGGRKSICPGLVGREST